MRETTAAARPEDLGQTIELLREGRAGIADARGGALWLARQAIAEPLHSAIGDAIVDSAFRVQLSFIDDVLLGIIVAEAETVGEDTIAVVHELYVTPEARGVGLGELMLDAVLDWATGLSCLGVDGYALPGDRATKNFFERFGLKARGIVVHRSIE